MKVAASKSTDHTSAGKDKARGQPVPANLIQSAPVFAGQLIRRTACACGGGCPTCEENAKSPLDESNALKVRRQIEPTAPVGLGGGPLPRRLGEYLRSSSSTGRPLEGGVRSHLERSFGRSLDNVRMIDDEGAARAAENLQARAFTLGNSIWFGRGEYRPETHEGRHLIAHEVAHSLQDPTPSGQVLADLIVGPDNDPAEREADKAAEAAVRGDRVSLPKASGRAVRLQRIGCSASPASMPNQRIVRCPAGDFLVTLTTTTEPSRPDTQTWADAGWNNQVIWLRLGVCRGGTAVTVTPTVDLPRAVVQALGNILSGSPALSGVTLTTGLQIRVFQNQSFTITLGPAVTVGTGGVSGVGGSVGVQTSDVTIQGQGTYDPLTGGWVISVGISPGARQQSVDCSTKPRERLVFECRPITHVPGRPEVPEVRTPNVELRYLFFNHARYTLAPDFQRPAARPGTTPPVDLRERIRAPTDILALHAQGYVITSIEGFTSPEGPRPQETRGFEGNIELAKERARAALAWVQEQCPDCDTSAVTPVGRAELPTVQGATEPEPTGRAMERGAVTEFLQDDPLRPTDPVTQAGFRSLPERRQRDQVFELQRRAVIRFERSRVTQERVAAVPARDDTGAPVRCSQEVIEAARASFGISII